MAVQDDSTRASATGADQGDVRRRNVPTSQANGNYVPKEVGDKVDVKTKKQVWYHQFPSIVVNREVVREC